MIVNNAAWQELREQIETYLKEDPNITDIAINYQIRNPKIGTKNFLKLNVAINEN